MCRSARQVNPELAAKDYAEADEMRARKRGGRGKARDPRIFPLAWLFHSGIREIMRLYCSKVARGKPRESSL